MFDANLNDFFVVGVISNTARFKRRPELFNQFLASIKEAKVDYVIVELAFGDRTHFITDGGLNDLQLRTVEEFWHKENLVNLGIAHGRRLWPRKKMVAWIDGDCAPVGKTFRQWFEETWHQLQHYEFVQMWQWLQHLDYDLNPLGSHKPGYTGGVNPSFMYNYITFGTPYPEGKLPGYPFQWGSPGLAWAANIECLDKISGIGDIGITGGGDWYLAHMLISDLPFREMTGYTQPYIEYWKHRQMLCERWVKRDVGFVKGLYTHFFHGKIKDRQYDTREMILKKGKFNPNTDLKRDHQGLWQLETYDSRQIWIRDMLRQYASSRNEDSIDAY